MCCLSMFVRYFDPGLRCPGPTELHGRWDVVVQTFTVRMTLSSESTTVLQRTSPPVSRPWYHCDHSLFWCWGPRHVILPSICPHPFNSTSTTPLVASHRAGDNGNAHTQCQRVAHRCPKQESSQSLPCKLGLQDRWRYTDSGSGLRCRSASTRKPSLTIQPG